MPKPHNPIKHFRGRLYKAARILGDITSIIDGTLHKHIIRRIGGRLTQRGLGSIFRKMLK